jgi:PAS domain S-box-containing protein
MLASNAKSESRLRATHITTWMVAFLFWLSFLPAHAAAERGKRVLIINSLGSTAPPFTTPCIAFETELVKRMAERVDLDEVYLDHTHYGDAEMEEALVQYLEKRQARWRPDLVVPIGSPAGIFAEKHRARLFPKIPVLYSGMDRRRLSEGALRDNAAFVGESFDARGFIDDMLQLAPDTTNIVCVLGASPVERYWTKAFQTEFASFTNRVAFTWLNDLPLDQILQRVQKLPARSYVFFILLLQDGAGVTQNSDEALSQVAKASHAPVNSIFEHQLGLGIVGGRLYRAELEGERAARIAARILYGEPASRFLPEIVPPSGPQYDWRAMRHWNISEKRLPPGAVVRYRIPTIWERHRFTILLGVSVLLIEAISIGVLILNLRRRIKAEQSLRESQERMKMAADAARLELWEWDLASDKVWLADVPRQPIHAGNQKEPAYSRYLRTVHPEDRDSLAQLVAMATTGDGNFEHVYRQLLADGQVRWVSARARVEFDARHKPVKMRGVDMDITARKVAEEKAQESERQFLLAANSAPVLIWESGTDKLCTFFNQPWLAFTGRTLEQELGNGWAKGVHPDDLARCLKIYTEGFDTRQPFTMEYRLRRHDGQYRWVADSGVPRYDAQGKFLGYIGSCVDVTEKKALEAEAHRWEQELAHISRLSILGELAGSLAHELNQPLTAIVSSAEAAERMTKNGHSMEDVREALKEIAGEGRRAGEIIAGMREMLRKDPGMMLAQNVNSLINEVLEMIRTDLISRQVRLVFRLDPQLPFVKGHGVQLRQVLLNLLMNACEAMAEVPAHHRELIIQSNRGAKDMVEVSVSDGGPGFSEEMLRHLFEPFQTTKSRGLGLGLAISRSIILSHGGSLTAANNSNGGARLCFTLPSHRWGK